MNHILVKFCMFLLGLVLGGAVVFGIMKLTGKSSADNSTFTSNGTRVTDSLQFIVVMSRHGNRGSSVDYPQDPYPINDKDYWPYGKNQLTNVGRRQEYNLGKKLRTLYNGFLSTTYNTSNVYSISDFVERVIYSGQLVLQGLFPPVGFQVWTSNIDWQPVELFTNSSDHSAQTYTCDRFQSDKAAAYSIFEEVDAVNISKITQYFNNISNSNETYVADNFSIIFEKIISEDTEGFTLPAALSGIYPDILTDFYRKNFVARIAGTDEMVRLMIGNLYEEVLDFMEAKINGSSPNRKMNYYSAHDCSIVTLQVALGMPRSNIVSLVKVGSAMVIELHQDPTSGDYYVKVIFIDGSSLDSDPISLSLPDCGEPCYYETLVNATRKFTNVSYEEECQTSTSYSTFDDLKEFMLS